MDQFDGRDNAAVRTTYPPPVSIPRQGGEIADPDRGASRPCNRPPDLLPTPCPGEKDWRQLKTLQHRPDETVPRRAGLQAAGFVDVAVEEVAGHAEGFVEAFARGGLR
jgi:hypothetical protein